MNLLNDFVLYSGGAYGADSLFGELFYKMKTGKQLHIRPENNLTMAPTLRRKCIPAIPCPMDKLVEASQKLKELGVGNFNPNTISGALQCRNYYQVVKSDTVLAVASLNPDCTSVKGGTNTAVQVGIKLNKPVYVLNTDDLLWYSWNPNEQAFEKFFGVPPITRRFTGVGTRDIESYSVKDKVSGQWISRPEYLGDNVRFIVSERIKEVFEKALSC